MSNQMPMPYEGDLRNVEWDHVGRSDSETYGVDGAINTSTAGVFITREALDRLGEIPSNAGEALEKLARIGTEWTEQPDGTWAPTGEAVVVSDWTPDGKFYEFSTISDFSSFRAVYSVGHDAMDDGVTIHGDGLLDLDGEPTTNFG
ncbi:hypothetical protein PBI_LAMBO_44 [Gordonia phage Lambo]|uniref:Uncharacterized protein n=1 Tax=Gordonia phage Lambo TaxID=2599845 RepID=A0A5J6TS08_9CAUD|nr:hypothetical protein HWC70_gp44 [Gordonia phage Lambo]QFG13553.1 hypothetical protein PBI_LAMBO_44 [Gordonia phage Lambo]